MQSLNDAIDELSRFVTDQAVLTADRCGFGFVAVPECAPGAYALPTRTGLPAIPEDVGAPCTWDDLTIAHRICSETRNPFPVSDSSSATALYGRWANYAFRFWHDITHVVTGQSFTFADERIVSAHHYHDACEAGLGPLSLALLEADTFGQLLFGHRNGGFVADQRRFDLLYVQAGFRHAEADALQLRSRAARDDGKCSSAH